MLRIIFREFMQKPIERIDRKEWDFSAVPREEERACCYFEWARESDYIVEELDCPVSGFNVTQENQKDRLRLMLDNSRITNALPGRGLTEKYFDRPWQAKRQEWRADFCQKLERCWNGVNFAPGLNKNGVGGFHLGMSPFFNSQLWTNKDLRCLDPDTGMETLLVTINWRDFTDNDIIHDFKKWIKTKENKNHLKGGRPEAIGVRSTAGKKKNEWGKKLERLAVLRLQHYYPFDEIQTLVPEAWMDNGKFLSSSEMHRERKLTKQTLLELFPFLDRRTVPRSWPPYAKK